MAGNSFVDNYFLQNYKIRKYFLQNLLWKLFYTKYFAQKLAPISCNFFFIIKFISIFYEKNLKQNWQEIWVFLIVFNTSIIRFDTQFAICQSHHLNLIALVSIRREKVESLWNFIEIFEKIIVNIRNLNPEVALHHMVMTLRPRPFIDRLCKKPTTNRTTTKFM